MSNRALRACVFFALCLSIGCNHGKVNSENDVLVFAAASTTDAMNEIADAFQKNTGTGIRTSFSSSSTLATQIIHGAKPDIFLSANLDWIDELEKRGHVHEFQKTIGNQLVLIVACGRTKKFQPSRLEDLTDPNIQRISIADPDAVPAGIYAKKALVKAGLWQQLKGKLVYCVHVRQALSQVESRAINVGIVYKTDARISKSVRTVCEIDLLLTGPIEYGIVLTLEGYNNPKAVEFFEMLCSAPAISVFEKHGFAKGADVR